MKRFVKLTAAVMTLLLVVLSMAGCKSEAAKKYVVLDEALEAEQYGIGFRNGDIALGLEVQKQLDTMAADGASAKIAETWFGTDNLIKDAAYLEESEAPAEDDSLTKVLDKGKLVVGLDDSFPPMGFRDEDNNIVGFDIDLAKEVCKRMGVELVLQPIDWDAKEMELNSGKIDCIWNGMSIDDERLANMYFTKPYIANRQIIIVPEGSSIKTIADLEGKKVGLQKGSTALSALTKNPISEKVTSITELADNVSVFLELKAGRIDAFVVDEVVGRYIMTNN
ncbi:MAG: transporter substrate-binding domain-containing protein [Eubacteriales bacterium]|nr:transporter substrate-binding domain-containing protein [Eubacteriales bacterium]